MSRIVIVTDTWEEQINGVTRTLQQTVNHLRLKNFEVHLIEPSLFRTIRCPTYQEIPISYNIWKVGKMIKALEPDYLHLATEGSLGLAAKLWADRRKLRYTTSYHTKFPEYIFDYLGFGLKFGYKAVRWFHKRANSVMVNTPTMKTLLQDHGFDNLSIWDRGVDTDLFHPDGEYPDLSKMPRPILLNVGRVAVEKNLPAFYELQTTGTKIQVGGGPMLAEYAKKYPDVHFVGPKVGEDLATYYRCADVFVFPSRTDTYGLVMLESIASGVPVAAFPVDGPRDVLIEGLNGSMDTDLAQAVKHASRIRVGLREWAMTKSWARCTEAFCDNLIRITPNP